jgi:hypothetical protein
VQLRSLGKVLCGVWACLAGWAFVRLALTCYFSLPYPMSMSAGARWSKIAEVSNLAHIPKPDETTLTGCPIDSIARWVPYFYRQPLGDLFPSIYYRFRWRPVTDPAAFQWYLFCRPDTSWKDEQAALFDNGMFTFSRPQTTLIVTNDGWYGADGYKGSYARWMNRRGRLLLIAPRPDTVTLEAAVHLAPDSLPKHLHYTLDGQPAGEVLVERSERLVTPPFNLSAGFHQLVFQTDEEPRLYGRTKLNLWFGDLHIKQPAPSFLDTRRAADRAFLEGLTPDGWVGKGGVHVLLRNPGASNVVLEIRGYALQDGVPGAIIVRPDDGQAVTTAIESRGPFACRVSLRMHAAEDLRLALVPANVKTPASLGINGDMRELGFRLISLGISE